MRETQKVEVFLNEKRISWVRDSLGGFYNGHFITPVADRQKVIWFLARLECQHSDIIRMKTSVFIRGMGPDEERSRFIEWLVDESAEVEEFSIRKVGDSHFPLLSGRVTLIQSQAVIEQRREQGAALLEESKE
jgi:hypothetical protein